MKITLAVRSSNFSCAGTCPSVDDLLRSCKHGPLHNAIDTLEALGGQQLPVSMDLFLCLVQKSTKEKDLTLARRLLLLLSGKKSNPPTLLADHLIRMFTSCGSLADANQVFCDVSKPSIFTWNAVILAHAKLGHDYMAIMLYCKMHASMLKPDKHLMSLILKICSNVADIEHGRLVHHQMISMKILSDISVDNALIFMYVKCGCLDDAQSVFDSLKARNIATWSTLIVGYSECGCSAFALELFQEMQDQGIEIDKVVFLCVFKACSSLHQGMSVHNQVVKHKLESNVVIASAVVDMYVKCRGLREACNVLDRVHDKDAALWNCIIAGCSDLKQDDLALELFQRMLREGMKPNDFIFSCILKVCGNARAPQQGRIIHDMRIRREFTLDVVVGNTLIDMYAQCGALEEALRVFDQLSIKSVVSWGTIIGAHADHGCSRTALRIFDDFQRTNLVPDNVIFLSVVKACSKEGDLLQGRKIHIDIIKHGLSRDVTVGNTLVVMYSKFQSTEDARSVFDALPCWSCVSWSAMLAGYTQKQQWTMALDLFGKVLARGVKLDRVIFLYALEACSNLGSMGQGRLIHDQIIRHCFESESALGSALLDAYCKCGLLHEGFRVFERLPFRDMVTWGAMIAGLVHGGNWPLARKCLVEMRQQGISPNMETYTCILIACSGAGLVEEGQWYFNLMKEDHRSFPKINHFSCMVDLFGRVGLLRESEDFVQTMPVVPNDIPWTSLLTSCKTYHNLPVGNLCFNEQREIS